MTAILVLCVLTLVTALVCLVFVYDAYKQLNICQELVESLHDDLRTHDEYSSNMFSTIVEVDKCTANSLKNIADALNEINKKSVRSKVVKKEQSQK